MLKVSPRISLISESQELTADWADLGSEIDMISIPYTKSGLYLNLDIGSDTNIRIRALGKHASSATEEYVLPILTVSASDIKAESEYVELNVDADQKIILTVDTKGVIPFVQWQVMAGSHTDGEILTAYVINSNND